MTVIVNNVAGSTLIGVGRMMADRCALPFTTHILTDNRIDKDVGELDCREWVPSFTGVMNGIIRATLRSFNSHLILDFPRERSMPTSMSVRSRATRASIKKRLMWCTHSVPVLLFPWIFELGLVFAPPKFPPETYYEQLLAQFMRHHKLLLCR